MQSVFSVFPIFKSTWDKQYLEATACVSVNGQIVQCSQDCQPPLKWMSHWWVLREWGCRRTEWTRCPAASSPCGHQKGIYVPFCFHTERSSAPSVPACPHTCRQPAELEAVPVPGAYQECLCCDTSTHPHCSHCHTVFSQLLELLSSGCRGSQGLGWGCVQLWVVQLWRQCSPCQPPAVPQPPSLWVLMAHLCYTDAGKIARFWCQWAGQCKYWRGEWGLGFPTWKSRGFMIVWLIPVEERRCLVVPQGEAIQVPKRFHTHAGGWGSSKWNFPSFGKYLPPQSFLDQQLLSYISLAACLALSNKDYHYKQPRKHTQGASLGLFSGMVT